MKIGDCYADEYNLIKDFSNFHYSGNLKSTTSNLYHKGYVELNNENIKYFEPYRSQKLYTNQKKRCTYVF